MWTVFINVDGHERGQTSCPVFLGLRYRQVVTLKRTYIIVAIFWVLSGVGSLLYCFDRRITSWYSRIGVPSCLVVSVASYTNIFRALRYHNAQVQDHIQQQLNHPNTLNIARYKKAVNSSLLIYLALLVFYLPYGTVEIVIRYNETYSSHLMVIRGVVSTLVYFNSTLNPFLYGWKIKEVRLAVKQTIRQALRCP